jgi:hypothetical protein
MCATLHMTCVKAERKLKKNKTHIFISMFRESTQEFSECNTA